MYFAVRSALRELRSDEGDSAPWLACRETAPTTVTRHQPEYLFCNSAHNKARANFTHPMRQQYNPRQDQPCADAPNFIALLRGKRTGRGSQRPDVHGMAGWKCVEPLA